MWLDLIRLTGHKRGSLGSTAPCVFCMGLAAATQQAGMVLAGIIKRGDAPALGLRPLSSVDERPTHFVFTPYPEHDEA